MISPLSFRSSRCVISRAMDPNCSTPCYILNNYNVVMAHPISVRFRENDTLDRLKSEAATRDRSTSALAEELIDEGLRMRRHPLIVFRDGASGRRAGLASGPDVWEVIAGAIGGDVPASKRMDHIVDVLGVPTFQVEAALAYYSNHTDEIDAEIAGNVAAAEEVEAQWRRQRDLLAQ